MNKTKIKSVYFEVKTPKMLLECIRAYYQKHTIAFQNGDNVYIQNRSSTNEWQRACFASNRVFRLHFTFDKQFSLLSHNIKESDNN